MTVPISAQTAGNVARFQAATDIEIISRIKPLTGVIPSAIIRAQTPASPSAMPCGSRSGRRWFVVHTNARAEFRGLLELARMGFEPYLPLFVDYKRTKRVGDPVKSEVLPLFPRYMFVSFDPMRDQWRRIFGARGIAYLFMSSGEKPVPVPRGVVERIQARGRAGDGVIDDRAEAFPAVEAGNTYRVVDGPFTGFEGACTMSDGRRVRLLLEMLGSVREVEFSKGELEKVV